MACDCRMMEAESRVATVQTIAGHMEDAIEIQREVSDADGNMVRCLTCGRRCTGYVTCLYILVKVLYALNVIGQLFLLNTFLGTKDLMYGFDILLNLLNGREWAESGHFPRVTMCDFEVRVLGNVHHHTVQCVLMINMFNEKIFLFLWFWFFLVGVVTLCSLGHWMLISAFPGQRSRFVKKYLKATNMVSDRSSSNKFVLKFLGFDGVFCLRMVSAHAGDLMATELIVALWHSFHNRVRKSPVEMYEPGAQGMSSPSKIQEMNFKNWLMGQAGGKGPGGQSGFESSNNSRGGQRKRRKSTDGYFSFA